MPNARVLGDDIFDANGSKSSKKPRYKVNHKMPYDSCSKPNVVSLFYSQLITHDFSDRNPVILEGKIF